MAKVEIISTEKVVVVEQKVIEQRVMLDLSMDEAKVLKYVLGYCGGSPTDSPRKFTQSMYDALSSANVDTDPTANLSSSIMFKDYDNV